MEIVIVSRKRPHICADTTNKLFPTAKVSVAEEEARDYYLAGIDKSRLLLHPNDIVGISKKRNWVLRNVKDETCVMVDDDCEFFMALVGEKPRRIREPEAILAILKNSEACAKALGLGMFGFNQAWDIRKFCQFKPFSFVGYAPGIVGIIGRDIWYDENQMVHDDVDYAMQQIMKHRVVWIDDRFGYVSRIQTTKMSGGCQGLNSAAADRKECMYLKKKWGPYYEMGEWGKQGVKSLMRVKRTQDDIRLVEAL